MLHRKMIFAIAIALVIVLSSFPAGWAGGPTDNTTGTVHADGGDGHPWDDGTSEQTSPGDDPGEGEIVAEETPVDLAAPLLATERGFTGWVQAGLISAWKVLKAELKWEHAHKTMDRRSAK